MTLTPPARRRASAMYSRSMCWTCCSRSKPASGKLLGRRGGAAARRRRRRRGAGPAGSRPGSTACAPAPPPAPSRSRARGCCRARHRPCRQADRRPRDPGDRLPHLRREPGHEVLGQERDVVAALAQRRQPDRDDVDAVEQVLAERALGHHLRQVAIGGGDDADVGLDLLGPAEPAEAALLQDAQQLDLHERRHLADLVEEDRALLGDFDQPLLVRVGAGERALHVAEELGVEQRLGQARRSSRATNGLSLRGELKWMARADQLLAGARLAGDQHGAVGRRRSSRSAGTPPPSARCGR